MIKSILFLSLFVTACVGVGENVVVFRGEIINPEIKTQAMNCLLSLQKDGVELMSYDIGEQFFVDYVVEPKSRMYKVTITCENYDGGWEFHSGPISIGSEPDTVVDFGKVELKKEKIGSNSQ